MSFHVGQLVKYVGIPGRALIPGLRLGSICTITAVGLEENLGVLIAEAPVPPGFISFHVWNFRPLDESRLDVFRKIAASPRKRIEVSA